MDKKKIAEDVYNAANDNYYEAFHKSLDFSKKDFVKTFLNVDIKKQTFNYQKFKNFVKSHFPHTYSFAKRIIKRNK